MFSLSSRRYTGTKTKLLDSINASILKHFDYTKYQDLVFFDVFAGTGVVSEYFLQKPNFSHIIMNDFLDSNYVIYQAFFSQYLFDEEKLLALQASFQSLESKSLEDNYYSRHFGDTFFSMNDSKKIGYIREEIERLLQLQYINTKEYSILLASLLYSLDRVANTVGHYDAYRKNVKLQDRLHFHLIKPLASKANIEIYKEDSNALVKRLIKQRECETLPHRNIDIAFIDPPYNSRQYSRFYHLLETITKHNKPKLYGIARKPKPENISKYCKVQAKEALHDLVKHIAKISKFLVVTYNNTCSANARSNTRLDEKEIQQILRNVGQTSMYEFNYKAFSSGKSHLANHKERIFICQV